jgi:sugar phosphate isomerase/epimerase
VSGFGCQVESNPLYSLTPGTYNETAIKRENEVNIKPIISAFADESSGVFDEQLQAVKRNEITHIELRNFDETNVNKTDISTIREIKRRADDAGVVFSAVGSGLGKCKIDDDIEQQKELCKQLIEFAHVLETPYIRMFSFRIPQDQKAADYRDQVMDKMGALVEVASGSGVMLAHENESHIYGETAAGCLDLYKAFYSTGVLKGVFDFANFIQAGEKPLEDCWPLLKPYTEYFHIKDALLADGAVVPAGQGDGHIKEILTDAIAGGFDSYLTLEPHLWPKRFGGTDEYRFDLAASALKDLLATILS